ncbi:deoxyribonuclease-1-like [Pseudonaja textilis]|uniref:deoxyribonuclease-1-like n=1 Tax=Pseudonaja textilis TaxID=8673 RepID=UPI000EA8F74F|nr:deoxyribonuclease-1-like [Pseudonaja textilis]
MVQAFTCLFLLLGMMLVAASFKICAFNIQSFGQAKAANQRVMRALVQILSRCDISAVQEVRDSKGLAIQALLQKLNRYDPSHHYSCLESKRLGRSSYKEQNVFVYRRDAVSVMAWCQVGDEDARDFARGPFAVHFHSPRTALNSYCLYYYHLYTVASDFVLLLHHTCPQEAVHELDLLFEVCMELMHWWKTENVMVLGDLNAGGTYIPMSAWARIRLHNHPAFHWLISDEEDTTVSHRTCCSYDRIIVHGEELLSAVVPGSAKPYNFTRALGLSEEEALEISDHYPVEVKLKLAPKTQRDL